MAGQKSDPSGYYRFLGLDPMVDAAAIKAAYRQRAKELHPDHNPAPSAEVDFQFLTEAWRVLGDPARRQAYDTLPAAVHPGRTDGPSPRPKPPDLDRPRACDRCGAVTAQPRHVVFPVVRGRIKRSLQSHISGVYCRRCCDIIALRTALGNWLLGWWSLPHGPAHTLASLMTLARGGDLPLAENHALLMRQGRNFLQRGDRDLAHGIAVQALKFARSADEEQDARSLDLAALAAATAPPTRALRDRWAGGTLLRAAQALPPLILLIGLGIGTSGLIGVVARDFLNRPDDVAGTPPDDSFPLVTATANPPLDFPPFPSTRPPPDGVDKPRALLVPPAPPERSGPPEQSDPTEQSDPPAAQPPADAGPHTAIPPDLSSPRDLAPAEGTTPDPTAGEPLAAPPEISGLTRPMLLRTGQLYEVTVGALPVRGGPGPEFSVIGTLDEATVVLVTENAGMDGWVKVMTADGRSGYVSGRYLTPGLSDRGLDGTLRSP